MQSRYLNQIHKEIPRGLAAKSYGHTTLSLTRRNSGRSIGNNVFLAEDFSLFQAHDYSGIRDYSGGDFSAANEWNVPGSAMSRRHRLIDQALTKIVGRGERSLGDTNYDNFEYHVDASRCSIIENGHAVDGVVAPVVVSLSYLTARAFRARASERAEMKTDRESASAACCTNLSYHVFWPEDHRSSRAADVRRKMITSVPWSRSRRNPWLGARLGVRRRE